jgi:hypothetical protein
MTRLVETLRGTPAWVFTLFFGLLALGLHQLRDRQVRPVRLAVVPLATSALSLYGVVATFGLRLLPSCAWVVGAALATGLVWLRPPESVRYDAGTRTVHLPGSAMPLAAMMGLFFTNYALTVALILQPSLRQRAPLVFGVCALFGLFSGLLAGRALRAARPCLRAPLLSGRTPACNE